MKTRDLILEMLKSNQGILKFEPTEPPKSNFVGSVGSLEEESQKNQGKILQESYPMDYFLDAFQKAESKVDLIQVIEVIDPSKFTEDTLQTLWSAYSSNLSRIEKRPDSSDDLLPDHPIIIQEEHPTSMEWDPPYIRFYAWVMMNLSTRRAIPLDIKKVSRDCGLSSLQIRESIIQLIRDGDLVLTREKGRELYRLKIQYLGDK